MNEQEWRPQLPTEIEYRAGLTAKCKGHILVPRAIRSENRLIASRNGKSCSKIEDETLGEIGIRFVRSKKGQTATEEAIIDYCQDKIAHIRE